MSAVDFTLDPHFSTPSGVALNKLARNPHFNVDIVHSDADLGTLTVDPISYNMDIPLIPNGNSYIETITPPVLPTVQYSTSLSGEYNGEPLVLINIERVSPASFRVEIKNESGDPIAARSVVVNFN